MTAPDNERPPTEDVRVSDEVVARSFHEHAVRRAADALNLTELRDHTDGRWPPSTARERATAALTASGYPEEVRLLTAELHASGEHLVRLNDRVAELEAEGALLREALRAQNKATGLIPEVWEALIAADSQETE